MEQTKEALQIFIQSLPVGCDFSILSFGTSSSFTEFKTKCVIPYNDETMQYVSNEVRSFSANFGGTNIHSPLKKALDMKSNKTKRIFILTDGQVGSPQTVWDLAG